MFDLIKNKYDQDSRLSGETEPITVQTEEGNNINAAAVVLFVVLFVLPISLIVYGTIHLHDCPAENMVAISLIVLGGLNLLSRLMSSPYDFRQAFGARDVQKNISIVCINLVLQFVIMGWFFALCYMIFAMKPDTKPESHGVSNYCALEFYRSVFWGSIVGLFLFGLMMMAICVACCYIASKVIASEEDDA